jgi:hypothetical protein
VAVSEIAGAGFSYDERGKSTDKRTLKFMARGFIALDILGLGVDVRNFLPQTTIGVQSVRFDVASAGLDACVLNMVGSSPERRSHQLRLRQTHENQLPQDR